MAHKVSNYRDLIVRIILIDKSFLPKISEYIPTSNLDVVNTIKNIMPGKWDFHPGLLNLNPHFLFN
jgi:glycerol-3-phosphate responsive antiterminator